MSLQQSLRTILLNVAPLVTLVGDRIRPDELDEADGLPALIIELNSLEGYQTLDPASGNVAQASLAVVCCGSTRSAATALETLVRTALDGYVGTVTGFSWRPLTYVSTDYDFESSEDGGESDKWFLNVVNFDAFVEQL